MTNDSVVPLAARLPKSRAELVLTEAYLSLHSGFTSIEAFRVPALAGLEAGLPVLEEQYRSSLASFPDVESLTSTSREEFERLFAQQFTPAKRLSATRAIDAASLVFAHAVFESTIHALIEVAGLVRRASLLNEIAERKVRLGALLNPSEASAAIAEALSRRVEELKRLPLVRKLAFLLAHFKCRSTFDVADLCPSVTRIAAIDRRRQALMHGDTFEAEVPNVPEDMDYLRAAAAFYLAVVALSAGLEACPLLALRPTPASKPAV